MTQASKATIEDKKSDYDKMLSIANPSHGPQILAEVLLQIQFSSNLFPKLFYSFPFVVFLIYFMRDADKRTLER